MRHHLHGGASVIHKPTIRVLMQRDAWGAPDGITRTLYQAGQEYDLPEDLADCFFSTGEADPAEAHAQPAQEAAEGAPETATQPEVQENSARQRSGKRPKRAN